MALPQVWDEAKLAEIGEKLYILEQALAEVKAGQRRGNIPQLGAALCHLEYHVGDWLKQLEGENSFFRASDFRRFIAGEHEDSHREAR